MDELLCRSSSVVHSGRELFLVDLPVCGTGGQRRGSLTAVLEGPPQPLLIPFGEQGDRPDFEEVEGQQVPRGGRLG